MHHGTPGEIQYVPYLLQGWCGWVRQHPRNQSFVRTHFRLPLPYNKPTPLSRFSVDDSTGNMSCHYFAPSCLRISVASNSRLEVSDPSNRNPSSTAPGTAGGPHAASQPQAWWSGRYGKLLAASLVSHDSSCLLNRVVICILLLVSFIPSLSLLEPMSSFTSAFLLQHSICPFLRAPFELTTLKLNFRNPAFVE